MAQQTAKEKAEELIAITTTNSRNLLNCDK